MTDFAARVRGAVAALPAGEVVTYGEVAREAGAPGAARAVGNLLHGSSGLPWWRVVAASGRLVPGLEDEHARRLREEGVPLTDGPDGHPRVARAEIVPARRCDSPAGGAYWA